MQNILDFKEKTVLITGGGKNIGKSIAEYFFLSGANVVINDILKAGQTDLASELLTSEKTLFSQGDIISSEYQEQLILEAISKFSNIEVLINNVGIGSSKGLFDMEPEIMKKSIETNLIAPFFLSQKVVKQMIGRKIKGSIVFISSIHRKIPSGNIDYSSSKRALGMIIKEMAFELGPFGIRVNGIAPGKITQQPEEDKRIPFNNVSATAEEIAKTVLFLTDNNLSGYITGEIITVDGGLNLTFER